MIPEKLKKNIKRASEKIKAEYIILWGFEYWYVQKLKRYSSYWEAVKKLGNE